MGPSGGVPEVVDGKETGRVLYTRDWMAALYVYTQATRDWIAAAAACLEAQR